jgi:hypothetical protein
MELFVPLNTLNLFPSAMYSATIHVVIDINTHLDHIFAPHTFVLLSYNQ